MDTNLFLRTHRYLSDILNPDEGTPNPNNIFGGMDLTFNTPDRMRPCRKTIEFDLEDIFQYGLTILLKTGIPLLSEIDSADRNLNFVLKSCGVNSWYQVLTKPLPTVWIMEIKVNASEMIMTENEMTDYIIGLLSSLVGMFDDLAGAIDTFSKYENSIKVDGLAHKKFLDGLPSGKKTLLDALPARNPSMLGI